jgi:hypothetical protein
MTINVTDQEKELLLELLETKLTATLHELHHTSTNDYKELLRRKVKLIEELKVKIENVHSLT